MLINRLLLTVLLCLPLLSHADMHTDLNKFFNKVGAGANVSSGDIYNGQKAGYMTGGGISIRNQGNNTNLANVNFPRFDAGCGGIDIFAGGFSFINKEQLITTLKSIASSSMSYAFMLGLETVSPQISNNIKQLQTWANHINSMNINSCEQGAQLVGAVWPRETFASQHICRDIGGGNGLFSDYAAARHGCSDKGEYDKQTKQQEGGATKKTVLGDEYNITWQALQKWEFLKNNQAVAEAILTLIGTRVAYKTDQGSKRIVYPSQIENEGSFKAILQGGRSMMYTCQDKEKCLLIDAKEIEILESESWTGRIKTFLKEMQRKVQADEEFSDSEKKFLEECRLPLYKIVNVLTAYRKGYCPVELTQVASLVALDQLLQYVRGTIDATREAVSQLKQEEGYHTDKLDEYLSELERIEQKVWRYEDEANHLSEREFEMIQKIDMIEKNLAKSLKI